MTKGWPVKYRNYNSVGEKKGHKLAHLEELIHFSEWLVLEMHHWYVNFPDMTLTPLTLKDSYSFDKKPLHGGPNTA